MTNDTKGVDVKIHVSSLWATAHKPTSMVDKIIPSDKTIDRISFEHLTIWNLR